MGNGPDWKKKAYNWIWNWVYIAIVCAWHVDKFEASWNWSWRRHQLYLPGIRGSEHLAFRINWFPDKEFTYIPLVSGDGQQIKKVRWSWRPPQSILWKNKHPYPMHYVKVVMGSGHGNLVQWFTWRSVGLSLTLFYSGGGRFAPTITYLRIRVCVCVYAC